MYLKLAWKTIMEKTTEYIFSINTGRSGSNYLKTLFDHVTGCNAFHEPRPIGNLVVMRKYARGRPDSMRKVAQEKATIIKNAKSLCALYVETNHCFIKGFGWFLPEHISPETMGVIILTRDPSKIAMSHSRIGCSPLTPFGRQWITTPDKKNPLVPPPAMYFSPGTTYLLCFFLMSLFRTARFLVRKVLRKEIQPPKWMAKYELDCLLWYVQETAAEAEVFKSRFPAIKYYEVNVDELNTLERVEKMFAYFGCCGKDSLATVVGRATNLKIVERVQADS